MSASEERAGAHPTVVLGVSGSIAAYKAAELARLCVQAGIRVVPVMTESAKRFVGPATLAGICGEPVRSDMFDPSIAGEMHVELAARADLVVLVPATAELLAALAQGRADDLLRALVLCARVPVLAAPAMHPSMWSHPATQRNVEVITSDGRVTLIGPVTGAVASGDVGMGRMAEPQAIFEVIAARLGDARSSALRPMAHRAARDLGALRLVVTAGPTVEDLDPARFLSNRSSGRMGFAVAERAAARGATVTLIAGPVPLPTPRGVRRVDVKSALDMQAALDDILGEALDGADALVMSAAVADYRPAAPSPGKLKKDGAPRRLELAPNPDILAEIGARRSGPRPWLVGFALETVEGEALEAAARAKLLTKRVDLVVANRASDAFERDDNVALLVSVDGAETLPRMPKGELADRILDRLSTACRKLGGGA